MTKTHTNTVQKSGVLLCSLSFPLQGVSGVRAGERKSARQKKETLSLLALLIFSHTCTSGTTCYFWARIFRNKIRFQKTALCCVPSLPSTADNTRLPFWCHIWGPGAEGNPIMLRRGEHPTPPPWVWRVDLAGIRILFGKATACNLKTTAQRCAVISDLVDVVHVGGPKQEWPDSSFKWKASKNPRLMPRDTSCVNYTLHKSC